MIFVRHGRTRINKTNRIGTLEPVPLDDLGREQAEKVSVRLEEFPFDAMYASPIRRTMETAEIIAEHLKLKINVRPELQEFNFGELAGLTIEEVSERYPQLYQQMATWMTMGEEHEVDRPDFPGGEKIEDFEKRLWAFRDHVLENHPGQVVMAVTHLSVIKAYMSILFGGSIYERMNYYGHNTSVSIIDFYRRVPILVTFNDSRHLDLPMPYGKVTLL